MPPGLDSLKHVVVLMMENRSFDHLLGSLKAVDPRIDGLTGDESNPDTNGTLVKVSAQAQYQSQLDPDPNHDFAPVNQQIFNGGTAPTMQGFIASYFEQRRDVKHSRKIMYYFKRDKLPILTTLALEYGVFNRWFASIPGPTLCNRAFAHYGTSFGHVGMELFYANQLFKSIYERLEAGGRTAKIYYYDLKSSTMEIVNLLQNQPQFFGTHAQFLDDCKRGVLPDYSFIEPNFTDHDGDGGHLLASDQHPDHHVLEGERFIATVYNAIRENPALWASTALLITYDEHGGIYDHVPPPACPPDGFVAQPKDTKTDKPFHFDRLGVRVPAVLVSPWVPKGTVVDGRVFEHASIPATLTKWLLPGFDETQRSPRERAAETFLDLLSLPAMRMDSLSRGAAAPGDRSDLTPELAIPKRPRNAFNPNRRASGLIKAQIEHLEAAAGIRRAKAARRPKERSEGEAAEYIAQLTAMIYAHARTGRGPETTVQQRPSHVAGAPTPTSRARKTTRAKRSSTARRKRSTAKRKPATRKRSGRTRKGGR